MDVREKLVELVHNARMNALWHNAQKPDEYITDMLMEGGVTVQEWISVCECEHETPSNADRIRAMTDKELAHWINLNADKDFAYEHCCSAEWRKTPCNNKCVACLAEWLKQPAE